MPGTEDPAIDILEGISSLDLNGGVPGRIVVYGEGAQPVLTGCKACDILIAVGFIGKGKIVVLSHDGFLSGFKNGESKNTDILNLQRNIKKWTSSNRTADEEIEVCNLASVNLDNFEETAGKASVLFWKGGKIDEAVACKAEALIRTGVGCVIGMCPWGFLQLNPGTTLTQMPCYSLLRSIGVCFTEDYYEKFPVYVDSNKARNAHCVQALKYVFDKSSQKSTEMFDALNYFHVIPKQEMQSLKTDLSKMKSAVISRLPEIVPSEACPVKGSEQKAMLCLLQCIHSVIPEMVGMQSKLPGVDKFPGDIPDQLPANSKLCVSLEIESHLEDVHPTGYYLLPGETLKLQILSPKAEFKGWSVIIGAHQDNLSTCEEIKRYPDIVVRKKINETEVVLQSPFGGSVYFLSPSSKKTILKVWIQNVIEAPYYNAMDSQSIADWPRRRMAPGLWADISGEFVTITLPAESVRNIKDPKEVMTNWDRVVRAHFHLKGSDLRNHRRQWFVSDIQPSAGYMHSGYPIVTHLDIARPDNELFVLNNHSLVGKGNWGLFHELGHNMQDSRWTFEGTVEVTCNVFTLHAMEMISGQYCWIHEWLANAMNSVEKYLKNGRNFEVWKEDPGVALFIYAQLVKNFGWEPFRKVFRSYTTNISIVLEQDKIDQWFLRIAEAVGYNLCPLLEFWGIPLSSQCQEQMPKEAFFLPDDEVTTLAPYVVGNILEMYPSATRVVPPPVASTQFPDSVGPPVLDPPTTRIQGTTFMSV